MCSKLFPVISKVVGCLIILSLFQTREGECANILFFFGISAYSHRVSAWPLVEALADKGHNVTFVSPFYGKKSHPKVFDYVPPKLQEWWDQEGEEEDIFADRKNGKMLDAWWMLPPWGVSMCDITYSDPHFLEWLSNTKSIDLVVINGVFNECAYGIVHKFGAKVMLFQTTTVFPWYSQAFGLPDESSTIPDLSLWYPVPMTFFQRLKNALDPIGWHYLRKWSYFPKLEAITKEKLGLVDFPKIEEFERNTSLILLNTHYGEEFARALPPSVVPIGGIAWTDKRKPLPDEIENFLKKGNGFIYVSFGTFADFQKMEAHIKDAFIGAFSSFPEIQFVWKVGNASLAQEFPDRNVYVSEWMPQQDILGHPKLRAFITHSGLTSVQEAVFSAVPLISFPIFADQDYNAERIHRKEYGIRLEITTVTQADLVDAIRRILTDSKYKDNMKRVSAAFRDRPQKPLETALWWTEYALRNSVEDLARLRPLSAGQSWWTRRQLDVWLVVLAGLVGSIVILIKGIKYCCCSKQKSQVYVKSEGNRKKTQ